MADAGTGEKLKVFISYSWRDSAAFADELVAGLELAGFARRIRSNADQFSQGLPSS
jgi:hypothetical protein